MRPPIIYCAGPNIRDLPGNRVDSILLNIVDYFATDSLTAESNRMLESAAPSNFLIDSGGYSLLKQEEKSIRTYHIESEPIKYQGSLNLTPYHVVDVVKKQRPHEFVALDFPVLPVTKLPDQSQIGPEFYRKLALNGPWSIETAELRQKHCPEIGLLIPVQCYNTEQLEIVLQTIDGINFDGFSLPTRNMGLSELASFMIRFYQLGIERVHLLGVTKYFTLALAAYMARHFFKRVSLDSRTWKESAKFSSYLNPHDLSRVEIGNNVIMDEGIKIDCKCPWCKDRSFGYIKHLPYYDKRVLLGCHNFWVTEKAATDLYQHSGSIIDLEAYLKLHSPNTGEIDDLINTLYLIEVFKNSDIRYLQN
jgi:hypothetical protein